MDSGLAIGGWLATAGAAALGSALQELLYWYNLRHKLDDQRYAKLVRSAGYWIVVLLMILGAGLVSIVWFAGREWPAPRDALTFGVGLPLLIKQLGSAGTSKVRFGPGGVLSSYWKAS